MSAYIGVNDVVVKLSRVQLDDSVISYSNWAAGESASAVCTQNNVLTLYPS